MNRWQQVRAAVAAGAQCVVGGLRFPQHADPCATRLWVSCNSSEAQARNAQPSQEAPGFCSNAMLLARARCPLACQAPCRHAGSNEALPATRAQPLLRLRGSAAARGMAPAGRERRRTVRVDAFSLLRNREYTQALAVLMHLGAADQAGVATGPWRVPHVGIILYNRLPPQLPTPCPSLRSAVNVPKPRWLPDFGLPKRCAVLDAFFNISDGSTRPAISRDVSERHAPCAGGTAATLRRGRPTWGIPALLRRCRVARPALPCATPPRPPTAGRGAPPPEPSCHPGLPACRSTRSCWPRTFGSWTRAERQRSTCGSTSRPISSS